MNSPSVAFLIDRRAIPNVMVWKHPDAAIDDPRPAAGSFNMPDVRRLSAHVLKLRDMPEGVLDNPSKASFLLHSPVMADAIIPNPTLEDIAVGTPSSKILAKDEASQKRKASTFGVASSHVAKRTRSPWLSRLGTRVGASLLQLLKALTPEGIMADGDVAPSGEVSRHRSSSRPTPLFRDVSGDAIHTNFFPFSAGPYYATYPKDSVVENCEFTREEWDAPYQPTFGVITKEVSKDPAICKNIVDQFPTPGEMVRVEGLSDDQLTTKMSVLHYSRLKGYEEKVVGLTSPKPRERRGRRRLSPLSKILDKLHSEVARLSAPLNQATIHEAERDEEIMWLKDTPSEFSSFFQGQFQGLVPRFLASDEFSRVHCEHLSLAASFGFERALNMHQTKDEFADISEYAAEPLSVILQLEPEKLSCLLMLSLPPLVTLEHNEEQMSVAVDASDLEMTDGAAHSKSRGIFVQGTSYVLDDVAEVTVVGSERASSSLTDVVVALSDGEKGDGFAPYSTIEEGRGVWYAEEHLLLRALGKLTIYVLLSIQQILSHATCSKPNGFPLGTYSIAGQASVERFFSLIRPARFFCFLYPRSGLTYEVLQLRKLRDELANGCSHSSGCFGGCPSLVVLIKGDDFRKLTLSMARISFGVLVLKSMLDERSDPFKHFVYRFGYFVIELLGKFRMTMTMHKSEDTLDRRASLSVSIRCAGGLKIDQRILWPEKEKGLFAFVGLAASQPCLLLLGRLGCRVLHMVLNVEVSLRGLLELDKSDLSGNKDRVQLGSSRA
nr:hypothetical protein [Tanacetum cinerariifolium]